MPPLPFISVIIPTYGRPGPLSACLEALCRIDYPRDRWETLVVDDGSPMDLAPVVSPHAAEGRLRLLRQANAGPAAARNTGAAAAQGTLLAFLDDDCRPHPGWLRGLARAHREHPEAMLGGAVENALADNPYSSASHLLLEYLYGRWNPDPDHARFATSNNLALPAAGFAALGGFDTRYRHAAGEDRELCRRWIRRGGRLLLVPEARIDHAHALDLAGFWRQHFGYGRAARRFRREALEPRGRGFHAALLAYPWRRGGPHRVRTSLLLLLSQLATAAGMLWPIRQ